MHDKARMTYEHVPDAGRNALGKKAPEDVEHGLMVCGWWNVEMAPRRRSQERALLARRYSSRNVEKTLDSRVANR